MIRYTAIIALTALCSTAFAGNARSDRTAQSFQQHVYQQQTLNAQWAAHFRAQQQDMAHYYNDNNPQATSRYGALRYRQQVNFNRWLTSGPRAVYGETTGQQYSTYRHRR